MATYLMKLTIRRNQVEAEEKTGLLSRWRGIHFILSYRIELTPEEESLIKKYDLGENPFYAKIRDKINRDVVNETRDVWMLYNIEKDIKENCKNLKDVLNMMASYRGEDEIEF
jgi:hypothetical protein